MGRGAEIFCSANASDEMPNLCGRAAAALARKAGVRVPLEKAPSEYMIHWHMMVARNSLKRDSSNLATTAEAVGFCDLVSV